MSGERRRGGRLDWKALLGIALGVGLLGYSLRGVDVAAVTHEIGRADPLLFLASAVLAAAPILVRAWRWRALLEPIRRGTSFRARFEASMIGFMANNVLPARIGEFARAYTLSRMEPVPVVASFGSLVVERLLDGVVVAMYLFLAMALPGFPGIGATEGTDPGGAALMMLALMGGVGLGLLVLVLRPESVLRIAERWVAPLLPASLRGPVLRMLSTFLTGLAALRRPSLLARAGLWSLGVWAVNAAAFWVGFRAFGIDVPFSAALFLQSLVALAVALPAAPGFFGLWEAATRVGLHEIWGVPLDKAVGFALGFHIGSFLVVTVWGLYYAWRLGLSWSDVRRGEAMAEREADGTAGSGASPRPEQVRR
ncbi:MAG TPA: lysylphosphatidylglycerol synthase transmembrane domain-containing protein [Longimicrobiales bacterium]